MFFKKFAILLAVGLLSFNLYANDDVVVEEDPNNVEEMLNVSESEKCDAGYSECMQICEEASDGQEKCFDTCDAKYDNCIKAAQ